MKKQTVKKEPIKVRIVRNGELSDGAVRDIARALAAAMRPASK